MNKIKALSLIAGALSFLVLAACASTSGQVAVSVTSGAPGDPVSLTILSYQDIRVQYGSTFMENPYIAPVGTILPTYNDYLVMKLNFNTDAKARLVLLRAEVSNERGKIYASFMTREKFTTFAMQQSPDQANNSVKLNKINWYYLPSQTMDLDAGKHSYVVVMVGRHPIPDTATVHVAVSLDDKATSFDIPVPISND